MLVTNECRNLTLAVGKHRLPVNLIILETQGLDVILGMDWMAQFEAVIDCANRAIMLTTPEKKKIRFKSKFEMKKVRLNSLKGALVTFSLSGNIQMYFRKNYPVCHRIEMLSSSLN